MIIKRIICIIFFFLPILVSGRQVGVQPDSSIRKGELVLKLKAEYGQVDPISIPAIFRIFQELGGSGCSRMFPHHGGEPRLMQSSKRVDLSRIYRIHISSGDPVAAAVRLSSCVEVEYAEPLYVQLLAYTPNDPDLSQQYFLNRIQAFTAWDISRGDTNTVIGIVDTGTDPDHPDLQPNNSFNFGDPINGMDDDGDGYTDNFLGWDISENDNDVTVGAQPHGSQVSGCASAATDNAIGVAGTGFRCRLLPVKAAFDASVNAIDHGYEGIVYAADHGCSVINCSWGRRGGASRLEQDVINYATFNRNALVVAAAGNQGADALFYPASYEHVLSVTATDFNDERASYSNFNYTVDLSAPGDAIYSTRYDNTYSNQSGTSMAAPVTAGCAAIVRSFNPAFTPDQVAARLRTTSDDIYSIGGNGAYQRKLGKGRVNLFRALTDSLLPGIDVTGLLIEDGNDSTFLQNDTLQISSVFTNQLHPTSALSVSLTTSSPYAVVLNGVFSIGVLTTLAADSNRSQPFRVRILGTAPLNTPMDFVMTITDGSYSDYYAFRVTVNVDYLNVTVNDVSTSVNSKGRIGYNKQSQTEGLGFTYLDDNSLLFSAGLMVGVSTAKVSDCVQGLGATDDDDFDIQALLVRKSSIVAPFVASGRFSDSAYIDPLPVRVSQYVYAWDNAPHRKYVVVKYSIRNIGSTPLSSLWAGIYADWDIDDYQHNKSATDLLRKMGYTWSSDTSLYTAVKVLSPTPFNHYAVDNDSAGLGGLDLSDGFTTPEKYTALSTLRSDAGVFGAGKDVINIVSSGPFNIAPGDSAVVAFALVAGDSLAGIQESADDAQQVYDSLLTAIPPVYTNAPLAIRSVYPNPAGNAVTVEFSLDGFGTAAISLFDVLGKQVSAVYSEKLPRGTYSVPLDLSSFSSSYYLLQLSFEGRIVTTPLLIY